jgi:hypothetical protein
VDTRRAKKRFRVEATIDDHCLNVTWTGLHEWDVPGPENHVRVSIEWDSGQGDAILQIDSALLEDATNGAVAKNGGADAFAPMPSATVRIAAVAKPGEFRRVRAARRRSRHMGH